MSIGAITIRAACVISQLIIAGAFLSLAFLRDSTVASLFGLGLDSIIVEGVYGAFGRYLAWMVLATIVVCGFTVVDLKGRSLVMRQALLIYGSLAFFLFYLIFSRCLQFPWSVDDSYIDYRYVYNWVNGVSFDYNPGQKVMGFTSHLHLALLSLGYSCFANIELPVISQTINVLLQVVSYFLVFVFMRCVTASLSTGVIAAAVLALFPYMTQETIGGKESPLVSFLILASLLAMQKRRLHLCAWLAALLLLTRPEGGLWLLMVLVWAAFEFGGAKQNLSQFKDPAFLWQSIKRILPAFAGPLLALVLVAVWLYSAFATVIPHGLLGKSMMFYKPFPLMDMVLVARRLGDGCLVPEFNLPLDPILSYGFDYFRLYAGVLVLLAVIKFWRQGALKFYAVAVIAYFLLFSIANPYLFPWYLCWFSLVPPLLVPILLKEIFAGYGSGKKSQDIILSIIAVYLVALQFIQQPVRFMPGLPSLTFFWNGAYERLFIYRQAALRARVIDPLMEGKLAAPEIGVLGYYYPGPILDLGGLVCDNVMKYGPPPPELRRTTELFVIIPSTILELKPRFLVTDGFFGEAGLFKLDSFKKSYVKDRFYPHALWSDGIYLFKRRDLK